MNIRAKSLFLTLAATMLLAFLFPASALAATRALGHDRNGTPYTYVIGYMYSGYRGNSNTREIFASPNNYDIWLCPTCGRGGGSNGTDLAENLYMPCYGYDIPASGGDGYIRYALVKHRHNNGQLSDNMVYIPINVAMYSACHYGYDTTPPTGPQSSAPAGWQRGAVTVNFSGGSDTGLSLPDWAAVPDNYGSGIHHYEYQIDGGPWTGCPVGQPSVTISKGGVTTVTSWLADGAGNASDQTASVTVYIDNVAPNAPSVSPATTAWTNQDVLVTVSSNGDTYSGVNRLETSLGGGAFSAYYGPVRVSAHGRQTVTARAVDNVGWVSGNASATVYIDKLAPVISSVSQTANANRTSVTFNISATDADSGVAGYAATRTASAPALGAFSAAMPSATENGSWTVWARDVAGNISAAKTVQVTAIDRDPPVVSAQTQRTWDAAQNWAKITASDAGSGVAQIGWSAKIDGSGITWASATANHTFTFMNNGPYYAYARDVAGNRSAPVLFTVDRIDKHSPVIDAIAWEKAWTQEKTVTVTAHDAESGLGQYAMTKTKDRPTKWQDSPVFPGITQNGTYYLWAKDKVQRVSGDPDADGGSGGGDDGGGGKGPDEIIIDTIDRSKPVMDAILHSATDNAPEGAFAYPCFSAVDRPELLAHDLADEGWKDSGIKAIYYQFVADGAQPGKNWQTYEDAERPAMQEEFFGTILAYAEDKAGNVSEPMDAAFLFEQTPPTAIYSLTPNNWTNSTVEIRVLTQDTFSGVRDIALPDNTQVEDSEATYTVEKNGVYIFKVRDNCGNLLEYPVEVSNIDLLAPKASYTLTPDKWTNQTVTIGFAAIDPEPEDGYAPSGVESITLPDGTLVEGDKTEFVVKQNGVYLFTVADRAGNSEKFAVEVKNIDLLAPKASYTLTPNIWTNQTVTIGFAAIDPEPEDGYAPSGVESITLPDGTVVEAEKAEFVVKQNGVYLFTVADRAGNSEKFAVEVKNIDLLAPKANYTLTPNTWTNKTVTIGFAASDTEPEDGYAPSGVESITLPDGTVVEGDKVEFVAEQNGMYLFTVADRAGNSARYSVTVENIDLTPPEVDFHFETRPSGEVKYPAYGETEFYNQSIALIAVGKDGGSDIARYEYRVGDADWQAFDPAKPPLLEEEQISTIQVRVQDVAGNVSEVKSRDIVLDKSPPKPSHTIEPGGTTTGKVTIHIGANYDICGPQSLVLPDGRVVYDTSGATFEVTQNGRYTFTFWDRCGNRTDYTVEVTNITAPAKAGGSSKPTGTSIPPKVGQEIVPQPTPGAAIMPILNTSPKTLPRLTLLDLFFTLLATLCATFALLRRCKKKEEPEAGNEQKGDDSEKETPKRRVFTRFKLPNLLAALAAIVLFFFTQPLVWRFCVVDIWTLLFAILGVAALWLMLWEKRKDEQAETDETEDTPDEDKEKNV